MSRLNGLTSPGFGETLLANLHPVHARTQLTHRLTNSRDDQPLDMATILAEIQQIVPLPLVRVGGTLIGRRPGQPPEPLASSNQLFAFVGAWATAEWKKGSRISTRETFFEFCRQNVMAFDAVEFFPHDRPAERILYHHPGLPQATGDTLPQFLAYFQFASEVDRTLFESFVLSMCFQSPGKKPLFVFVNSPTSGNSSARRDTGRGIGKTTVVDLVAEVVGGVIEASVDGDEDRLRSRLLSDGACGRRVVRFDNVKSDRLSCAMIERLITASKISGHRLFHGEASRPNHFVFAMTVNGPNFSDDLAARSVLIRLSRPQYDPLWEERVTQFIGERRWHLIADILAKLEGPPLATISQYGRFAGWEERVVSRCQGCDAALAETRQRRQEVDGDLADAHAIQDALNARPLHANLRIPVPDMVQIVAEATGEQKKANKLKNYLERLGVPGLEWDRTSGVRFYRYHQPTNQPPLVRPLT